MYLPKVIINSISWLHLEAHNIHGFALFNHLSKKIMCKSFISILKWVSLTKSWRNPYFFLFFFTYQHLFCNMLDYIHCQLHIFINLWMPFWNNVVILFFFKIWWPCRAKMYVIKIVINAICIYHYWTWFISIDVLCNCIIKINNHIFSKNLIIN